MPDVIFNGPGGRIEGRYRHAKVDGAAVAIQLITFPLEHVTKVAILSRVLVFLTGRVKEVCVNISQCDDVLTGTSADVGGCTVPRPDGTDVKFFECGV